MMTQIYPADEKARLAARGRWNSLAHPLGGLGLLESAVEDIAALTGAWEVELEPRTLLVFCGDSGVVARGVTQTGSDVTAVVARNLARGSSTVSPMAALARCRVLPVDMGIRDFDGFPGVENRRVRNGAGDISVGPAMTRQEAETAIRVGIELAQREKERGTRLLAAGEMGIGNTTATAAVTAALLGLPAQKVTGRGAGLSDEALKRKVAVVEKALDKNAPNVCDPVDVLAKVGCLELAGLCGLFLGGALARVPVLLDGAVTAAAALCALRLAPRAEIALFASHVSAEPSGRLLLEALGKKPLIDAGMRLGEGTGAVAAMPLLDMALAVYKGGSTFADYGIRPYVPQGGKTC